MLKKKKYFLFLFFNEDFSVFLTDCRILIIPFLIKNDTFLIETDT